MSTTTCPSCGSPDACGGIECYYCEKSYCQECEDPDSCGNCGNYACLDCSEDCCGCDPPTRFCPDCDYRDKSRCSGCRQRYGECCENMSYCDDCSGTFCKPCAASRLLDLGNYGTFCNKCLSKETCTQCQTALSKETCLDACHGCAKTKESAFICNNKDCGRKCSKCSLVWCAECIAQEACCDCLPARSADGAKKAPPKKRKANDDDTEKAVANLSTVSGVPESYLKECLEKYKPGK